MVLETIRLFLLEDYDGADGMRNRPNGMIVRSKALAEKWAAQAGDSYKEISGVIVDDIADLGAVRDIMEREAALKKLSPREKKLLGLSE